MSKYWYLAGTSILLASSLAYGGSAYAPYVGASVGYNTAVSESNLSTACGVGTSTCQDLGDTEDAWRVYAGYPITDKFAAELGYTDLVYTARLEEQANGIGVLRGEQKTKGVTLGLTAKQPVTQQVDVYGKLGAYVWDSKANTSLGSADDSGTSPTVGLGVAYNVNEQWGVNAGWDRYFDLGTQTRLIDGGKVGTVDEDIDTFSVGLNYNF